MLCQECEKNPATVHFTKIINNKKTEVHLCQECAKEHEGFDLTSDEFSLQNFLTGMLEFDKPGESGELTGTSTERKLQCDQCELTYQQFAQIGRFGCSECYQAFSEYLKPMLKRIHGSVSHAGKVPKRTGGTIRIKKQINQLKVEIQNCIDREDFEKAAELRDEIKKLEQELL